LRRICRLICLPICIRSGTIFGICGQRLIRAGAFTRPFGASIAVLHASSAVTFHPRLPIRMGPAGADFATIRRKGRRVAGFERISIIGPWPVPIGTRPGPSRRISAAKATITGQHGIGNGRRFVEGGAIGPRFKALCHVPWIRLRAGHMIRSKGRWIASLGRIGLIGPRPVPIETRPSHSRQPIPLIGAAKATVTGWHGIGKGRRFVEGCAIGPRRLSRHIGVTLRRRAGRMICPKGRWIAGLGCIGNIGPRPIPI
jgi:hypothetical protein